MTLEYLRVEDHANEPTRILLVEDHASFRQTLALVFDQEPDFEVVAQAGTVAEARLVMANRHTDLAVVDLSLPDGEAERASWWPASSSSTTPSPRGGLPRVPAWAPCA